MSKEDAPEDAIAIAALVARAIETAGGRYFIGGSLASSMQGEPRATNDIDIVIDLPLGKCRALVDALGARSSTTSEISPIEPEDGGGGPMSSTTRPS